MEYPETAAWPSGVEEEKKRTEEKKEERKEKTPVSLSKALSRLVPYRLFYRVGIACRKMVY